MSEKAKGFAGTEISAEQAREGAYLLTRYQTELSYSWSSGKAISRFLAGLREGELWGRRCSRCDRTLVPPRMYCEMCFRPTDDWVKLESRGRVVTYSVSYVNADATRRKGEEPILIAVIEIGGASPLMGILHLLGEVEADEVAVGMEVEAVWKPQGKRQGAITDIRYFRPSRKVL